MKNSFYLLGGTVALVAGCASTPTPAPLATTTSPTVQTAAPKVEPVQTNARTRIEAPATALNAPSINTPPAYLDPNNPLSREKSVYFDFDQYSIKDQYRPVVNDNANYLEQHPVIHVRIEGNTDERGSREYNLALGNKRALAVAKALETKGVTSGQLETISYGKEKPLTTGHDEMAWSKNRRADIDYTN